MNFEIRQHSERGFLADSVDPPGWSLMVRLHPDGTETQIAASVEALDQGLPEPQLKRFVNFALDPEQTFTALSSTDGAENLIEESPEAPSAPNIERYEFLQMSKELWGQGKEEVSDAPKGEVLPLERFGIGSEGNMPGGKGIAAAIAQDGSSWGTARQVFGAWISNKWDGIYAVYRINRLMPMSRPDIRVNWLKGIIDNANLNPAQRTEVVTEYNRTRAEIFHHGP
jgi:hypothetical protein